MLLEKEDILKRMVEYHLAFTSVADQKMRSAKETIALPEQEDEDNILLEETENMFIRLKKNKSPRVQEWAPFQQSQSDNNLIRQLHALCSNIWNKEKVFEEWGKVKQGNLRNC